MCAVSPHVGWPAGTNFRCCLCRQIFAAIKNHTTTGNRLCCPHCTVRLLSSGVDSAVCQCVLTREWCTLHDGVLCCTCNERSFRQFPFFSGRNNLVRGYPTGQVHVRLLHIILSLSNPRKTRALAANSAPTLSATPAHFIPAHSFRPNNPRRPVVNKRRNYNETSCSPVMLVPLDCNGTPWYKSNSRREDFLQHCRRAFLGTTQVQQVRVRHARRIGDLCVFVFFCACVWLSYSRTHRLRCVWCV